MDWKKLINGLSSQQYHDEMGNHLKEDPFFTQLSDTLLSLESPRKVEAFILSKDFAFLGKKTTICTLTTVFGYEVTGSACPVVRGEFDEELGKKLAYNSAVNKLEELNAYLVTYLNSPASKK